MQRVDVHRIPTAAPDDTSGLDRLIERGTLDPHDIICVLGKTEGNGCVNDWSRGLATMAYKAVIAQRLGVSSDEAAARVLFIMSGGTEGVLSPHVTLFARREVSGPAASGPRLAAGIFHTPRFKAEELGTMAQVRGVEHGVRAAMTAAGIAAARDVHFVQIKCPLLTAEA